MRKWRRWSSKKCVKKKKKMPLKMRPLNEVEKKKNRKEGLAEEGLV